MDTSRREFLAGLGTFGLGCGFACGSGFGAVNTNMTGRIPPRQQYVVEPWNEGRLRISSHTVDVGATKPFRAVHFSDTHVNFSDIEEMYASEGNYRAGTGRYARFPQAVPSFYATLDFAAREPGTLLLHTGDLIDFGTRACYDFVRHNLKGLDLIYAVGNHEFERPDSSYNPDPEAQMAALAATGVFGDLSCSSRVVNGVNFVAFDNARFGRGNVLPRVRESVRRELDRGLPVVLMCHIPPYVSKEFHVAHMQGEIDLALQRNAQRDVGAILARKRTASWNGDEETVAFWKEIREHANFKALLCGHRHWPWSEPFGRGVCHLAGGNFQGCVNELRFV